MFEPNQLIGLPEGEACKKLKSNGYNKIEVKQNSVGNDRTNASIVCGVRLAKDKVVLICGEFCIE